MLDIYINIENGDILALMKDNKFQKALDLIKNRNSNEISFYRQMHLFLLQAQCYYCMGQYPLAVNTLGKILKHRYNSDMEHHLLAQGFYLLALTHMKHSEGKNKAKNRSTFIAISSCMSLLCYRGQTLVLMDDFLKLVGEK